MNALHTYIITKANMLMALTALFSEDTKEGRAFKPEYLHLSQQIEEIQREIIAIKQVIGTAIAQDDLDYFEQYEHDPEKVYAPNDHRMPAGQTNRIINPGDVPPVHYSQALPLALQQVQALDEKVLQFFLNNYVG